MDDVFDFTVDDKYAEMELANQEWAKKMHEVALNGEREALSEGFESRLVGVFGKGLNTGFEVMKDFGILEGRLLFLKSKSAGGSSLEKLLSSLQTIAADVIRELAGNKQYFNSPDQATLSSELIEEVNAVKEEVNNFLKSYK